MAYVYIVLSSCFFLQAVHSSNIVQNDDFELDNINRDWFCENCTMTAVNNDSYLGNKSVLISHSISTGLGPGQTIEVTPGNRYTLRSFVRLTKMTPGQIFNRLEMVVTFTRNASLPHPSPVPCEDAIKLCHLIPNGCDDVNTARTICRQFCNQCNPDLKWVGTNPKTIVASGWQELGGDIHIPTDVTSMDIRFRVFGAGAEYLLDWVSVNPLPEMLNWKNMANTRIEMIRKSNINISVVGDQTHGPVSVEVVQMKHGFPFGSAVTALGINNSSYTKYQDFFYDNFNWAVLENDLKWGKTPVPDYETPKAALTKLLSKGIKVRGHTVFWGVSAWGVQQWVALLNDTQLVEEMNKRYEVINVTKGMVQHWDVNNENQHGQYFEIRLSDPHATAKMFERVHGIDSNVHLFLNDFDLVLESSSSTTSFKNQGIWLRDTGVPLYGLGIQSHLRGDIDLTGIKYRLDKIAEAGLPMWITEMSINEENEAVRAQYYEDVLTLYFSHPAINGILLWGFWDQMIFQKNAAIVNGPDLTPNEAGRRVLNLLNNEWKTNTTVTIDVNSHENIRGFHGTYMLNVRQNNKIIKTETFDLDNSGKDIKISLNSATGNFNPPNIIFG